MVEESEQVSFEPRKSLSYKHSLNFEYCPETVAADRCEGAAGPHKAKPRGADLRKDEEWERTPWKIACKKLSVALSAKSIQSYYDAESKRKYYVWKMNLTS